MLKQYLIFRIFRFYYRTLKYLQYIVFISLLFCKTAYSNEEVSVLPQDIVIDSDSLIFDSNRQFAVFEGNVILHFKDMVLKTSKIEIFYKQQNRPPAKATGANSKKNSIEKIIIPAQLFAEKGGDLVIADKGEYVIASGALTLTGNVKLMYQENILKTNRLLYYTKLTKIDNSKTNKSVRLKKSNKERDISNR